ncbi:putative Homeodomain-like, Homeodomain-related, Homeobox protein [Pseudoloma neurophilia]|uniref:Putative Homeodomain-like, Homeodomain-related, Homeobox protein n=1 Tax=Pseudoloma neurophilia TaxID=146866 RepID=A0A0R0M1U1_9MICR|nr:putative Homeodomain-like, Homeodomain-related, Homeobox protein [Pseudoloma neurophilia]
MSAKRRKITKGLKAKNTQKNVVRKKIDTNGGVSSNEDENFKDVSVKNVIQSHVTGSKAAYNEKITEKMCEKSYTIDSEKNESPENKLVSELSTDSEHDSGKQNFEKSQVTQNQSQVVVDKDLASFDKQVEKQNKICAAITDLSTNYKKTDLQNTDNNFNTIDDNEAIPAEPPDFSKAVQPNSTEGRGQNETVRHLQKDDTNELEKSVSEKNTIVKLSKSKVTHPGLVKLKGVNEKQLSSNSYDNIAQQNNLFYKKTDFNQFHDRTCCNTSIDDASSDELYDLSDFDLNDKESTLSTFELLVKPSKYKKRNRTIMTDRQSYVLKKYFCKNPFPNTSTREELGRLLHMRPRTVQIWFQNMRQKNKSNIKEFYHEKTNNDGVRNINLDSLRPSNTKPVTEIISRSDTKVSKNVIEEQRQTSFKEKRLISTKLNENFNKSGIFEPESLDLRGLNALAEIAEGILDKDNTPKTQR